MSSYVQEFLRGIEGVHQQTAQGLAQLREADEKTSALAAEVRQLEQELLDELRNTAEFKGEEQYAERLKDIAAKRRKLNDEMAVQGQGIRAVYSMLDDVIMTLDQDITKLNEVLSIHEMMQLSQSKAGRRKSDVRKADRIGSTILMPDLKSADDAMQPKYCYCQQISFGTMIGCDNEDCKYEWFHTECLQRIGIDVNALPDPWICPFCANPKADDAAIIQGAEAAGHAVSSEPVVKEESVAEAAEHKS